MACIWYPSFAILINGTHSSFFRSTTRIYQDYPPSPFFFICCTDILSWALWGAIEGSSLDPYVPISGAQLISHLLYVNDSLLLGELLFGMWLPTLGFLMIIAVLLGRELIYRNHMFSSVPELRPISDMPLVRN